MSWQSTIRRCYSASTVLWRHWPTTFWTSKMYDAAQHRWIRLIWHRPLQMMGGSIPSPSDAVTRRLVSSRTGFHLTDIGSYVYKCVITSSAILCVVHRWIQISENGWSSALVLDMCSLHGCLTQAQSCADCTCWTRTRYWRLWFRQMTPRPVTRWWRCWFMSCTSWL